MIQEQVTYLMLKRQGFIEPTQEAAYEQLFRAMSPVPTLAWTRPGAAPEIGPRCDFDDREANDFARRMRAIVKGRFQGGRVGYVYQDEVPLFATVYKKPVAKYTEVETTILTLLKNEGPMSLKMMKEITGILSKDLSKAAQRLQKAFILYEDQLDDDWERAWYLLEEEFDHLDFNRWTEADALDEVVKRAFKLNVVANQDSIKSLTALPVKKVKATLERLEKQGVLEEITIEGKGWFVLKEDLAELKAVVPEIPDDLYLLDGNDYIVRSQGTSLAKAFGKSHYKTIRWIMWKGRIIGRVLGHFRFGPPDLEDVEIIEDLKSDALIKGRILEAVDRAFEEEGAKLKRFEGESVV